uniref:Putative sodium-coupled neutral amino acid transporter 11 n=1 Tax=Oryzias latipes TaxID=8090 RepID=A0A3B3I5S9_ORYLA
MCESSHITSGSSSVMAQQQGNDGERDALISPEKASRESINSMITASFNFINSIIGSGIIGLPYALNQAGLPLGLVLLIAVACITDYSIVLLIKGGNLSGSNSYQSLVQSTFGFPGYLILSVLQFLYPFIAMISYNITTGDTLTKVFQRIPGGRRTLHAYRWINASFYLMDVIYRGCLYSFYVCSWSRSHTGRASLCDLALYLPVHSATISLSKH